MKILIDRGRERCPVETCSTDIQQRRNAAGVRRGRHTTQQIRQYNTADMYHVRDAARHTYYTTEEGQDRGPVLPELLNQDLLPPLGLDRRLCRKLTRSHDIVQKPCEWNLQNLFSIAVLGVYRMFVQLETTFDICGSRNHRLGCEAEIEITVYSGVAQLKVPKIGCVPVLGQLEKWRKVLRIFM